MCRDEGEFMKKIVIAFLLFFVAFPIDVFASENKWTEYTLIAHAFGGISGKTYTNSYEALIANYEKGHRVFEVDLQFTSDDYLVARHDWGEVLYKHLEQTPPSHKLDTPLTLKEFKDLKINKKYTALEFSELVKILADYPDIYIVTDTKDLDKEIIIKQFKTIVEIAMNTDPSILDRIIPQIYYQEMYDYIDSLHKFKSYIYTLYQTNDTEQQVIEFAKNHDRIDVITMPFQWATKEYVSNLKRAGKLTYVHTINDIEQLESLKAIGVHGYYTDHITYDSVEQHYNKKIADLWFQLIKYTNVK
jgi:glycerophosphoryl diester phosphodiesterase